MMLLSRLTAVAAGCDDDDVVGVRLYDRPPTFHLTMPRIFYLTYLYALLLAKYFSYVWFSFLGEGSKGLLRNFAVDVSVFDPVGLLLKTPPRRG